MARPMTPRQRAALRKAQIASANKRRGTGKKKPSKKARNKALKQANKSANLQKAKHRGRRSYNKDGVHMVHQVEADRVNKRRAIKNEYRSKKGKKAKSKKAYTAKKARRKAAYKAVAAVYAANVALNVASAHATAKANGTETPGATFRRLGRDIKDANSQLLHDLAGAKRASNARKAFSKTSGIGQTPARDRMKYTKPRGRKKVYKVTNAKRARRR